MNNAKPYEKSETRHWCEDELTDADRVRATIDERDRLRVEYGDRYQECSRLEDMITALQEQMSRLVEQSAKAVAEAREEQREACALAVEVAGRGWQCSAEERDSWTRRIRATPLDSTPLAARIAELEETIQEKTYSIDNLVDRALAAESALAAEVERHQATAQDAADLRMMLSAWESGDLRPGYIAATEEAIEGGTNRSALSEYAASLPAGPREVR